MDEMKKTYTKFQGWNIVILSTLIMTFVGNFQSNVHTVANGIMMASPGNTISQVTHGFVWTVVIAAGVVLGPVAGYLSDKIGAKALYITGSVVSVIGGFVLVQFQPNNGFIYVLNCGIVYSIAFMFTGSVTGQTLVNNWLFKLRGRASALINTGTVFAGVVTPIIANAIINRAGGDWKAAYYFYGATSIVGVVMALFLINKPSDIGQYPDGNPSALAQGEGGQSVTYKVYKNVDLTKQYTLASALKTPFFWLLLAVFIGLQALSSFLMSPGTLMFLEAGFDMSQISPVLSIRQVIRLVFLLLMMKYMDRIEPLKLLGIICGCTALGYFLSANLHAYWQVFTFYAVGSIANSTCLSMPGVILGNIYGYKHIGKIYGFVYAVAALVSSPLSTLNGVIRQSTGSYMIASYLHAGIGVATVFLILGSLVMLKREIARMSA